MPRLRQSVVSKHSEPDQASARERLLAAADDLFYSEGVNTVGIDRVIARAGVAKASLYQAFGSKEALIRTYLERRHQRRRERMERALQRYESPRERLLAIFDVLHELSAQPGFRGCAFVNASAEARSGSAVEKASDESRAWLRTLLTDLARAAGASEPDILARRLVVLYDGAIVGARMDRRAEAIDEAKAMAAEAIAAAIER